MVPLRLGERLALALLGAMTCAAALAFSIDNARGAAGSAPPDRPGPAPASQRESRDVLPVRDPFGGDPALVSAALPSPASPAPIPPALPAVTPPPLTALTLGTTASRVTATVTGARPFAVLDGSAGAARIVTVGDAVGMRTVLAIDAEGVHLSDGTTLSIATPGRMRLP